MFYVYNSRNYYTNYFYPFGTRPAIFFITFSEILSYG